MIVIENLLKQHKSGGETVTACDVSELRIAVGEQVAVVGRSGLGKTTLLNIIAGIQAPTAGRVCVDGVDMGAMRQSQRDRFRGENIGMVFQTFNLLMPFSALENVLLGAVFGHRMAAATVQRAEALLRRVGLGDRLHHRPNQLSVGQVQRVAICRALINQPRLVLADEPLGNQDRATGGEVLELLLQFARDEDMTVVMVTHDPQAAELMQRTIDLADLRRVS